MPPRAHTLPRKNAVQTRSKATVDAILEATARILVKEGYDHASTNRVAEAAGVSIGSLYQYFPSKEALVAALAARHMATMTALVRSKLAEVANAPMPVAVRTMIDAMFEAHGVDPRLHKVLIEEVPRIGRLENLRHVERETEGLVAIMLESRKAELRRTNVETMALLLVTVVEAATHAAVLAELEPARSRAVADELTDLVLRYLVA